MSDTERIVPFSNGSQWADWEARNCNRCTKGVSPDGGWPECPIQSEVTEAYFGGGISPEIAKRMGYDDDANDYSWACTEWEAS